MTVEVAFGLFAIAGSAAFRWLRVETAVLLVVLGGWIALPVVRYPASATASIFPYWIIGSALPSDLLLDKAALAPLVALVGSLFAAPAAWRRLRPTGADALVAGWCAWPMVAAFTASSANPPGPVAAAYLAATWGAPWWLGRVFFGTPAAQRRLLGALVGSALICLPFALVEGIHGPGFYDAVYGPHPFRLDGAERYLGYRPLGFFEHGNQYGLWVSLCALVAIWWVAADERGTPHRRPALATAAAAIVAAMALAAQSVGALLLAAAGAVWLTLAARIRPRAMVVLLLGTLTVVTLAYLSGSVPVERIGRGTVVGQHAIELLRSVGRGSFAWRISQDQKLLADALQHPLLGASHWDWWRPRGTRPWGFAMLVFGQFGFGGLLLAFGAWLAPAVRAAWYAPRASGWRTGAAPLLLAALVALAAADALLNAFIFYPALLVAGALASTSTAALRGDGTPLGATKEP